MRRARLTVDLRLVGAGLLAGTVALVVLLVTAPPDRVPILIAGSDLPAGIALSELDVAARDVEDVEGLIVAESRDQFAGHWLAAPLTEGAPIPRSLLSPPESGRGADLLGLDLDSAAAVHGWLRPGDLVDVYSVGASASVVAHGVSVIDVEIDSTSLGSGRVHVVLAVSGDLAAELLAVANDGDLHLIRKGS